MKKLQGFVFSGLLTGVIFIASTVSAAEDFVEPGRFGIEGLVTADGVHAGALYVHDKFEVGVDFDGGIDNTQTGDFGIDARAGYRINAGNYNYFSLGVDMHNSVFQVNNGSHFSGTYFLGPYVGFQRYFPNTPVMLTVFLMPVTYNHQTSPDQLNNVNAWQFFQQGGLGIAYLF